MSKKSDLSARIAFDVDKKTKRDFSNYILKSGRTVKFTMNYLLNSLLKGDIKIDLPDNVR